LPLTTCRHAIAHRLYDKDAIAAAQELEGRNPLTLAELFRLTLAFVDEEVCMCMCGFM
jgi:hypothetical protein